MYGLYQMTYFTVIDILRTLASPFFILINFMIYFQYSKVCKNPLRSTLVSNFYGILGGLVATLLFIYLEIYIVPKDFLYILFISLSLSLIDKRFICISYGGSILVLINLIFDYPQIKAYEIMITIGLLHVIESFLILLNGRGQKEINFFKRDNRIVAGLSFNSFWPLPFIIFIGDIAIRPINLIAILNYSDYTLSNYPEKKTLETAILIFFYSGLSLIITIMYKNYLLSSIYTILGHEFIIYLNKLRERSKTPFFSESKNGIRVLGVKRKSLASSLGIREGDVLLKINNRSIRDEDDLKSFEYINHSLVVIEYFSLKKGLVKARYKGHKKTLGIETFPKVPY